MIDRAYTKAEARYIPNGPNSTSDMAHPTRTGDLVVFAYPPYQYDAETPGTLVAPSHFFGQHGYVPDVQDLSRERQHAGDLPRRRRGHRQGRGDGEDDRPRADARVPARDPRAAAQPGEGPARRPQGRELVQAALDHRAERLPRPARPDDAARSTGINADGRRRRVPRDDVRRGVRRRCPAPEACCWRRATTSARRRRTRRCCRTCRRSTSRTRGAWTRRRTATTSSTSASRGCSRSRRGRTSRSWRRTSSTP